MILEAFFLLFVALAVFFGLSALRALIIKRWIADSIADGTLIPSSANGDDDAAQK